MPIWYPFSANISDLRGGQLSTICAVSHPIPMITNAGIPSEIAQSHIQRIIVIVAGFLPLWAGTDERTQHETMNWTFLRSAINSHLYCGIAAGIWGWIHYCGRGLFWLTIARLEITTHAPKRANLISGCAHNRAPFFGFKFFDGKLWISHDLNLRDRLGLWSGSLTAETVSGPLVF